MADLFPDTPASVSLPRQVECLEREVRMRERTYPRWVADGRMSQAKADAELAAMRAALDTLCKVTLCLLARDDAPPVPAEEKAG